MAKAELYHNTQEYMDWKELQKNYCTSAQTKGGGTSKAADEAFRLGLTDGLVLYKVNCK